MQVKEAQQKRLEVELHKIVKQKDMEIYRLQGDCERLQHELKEMSRRGLSGGARGVFVAERTRLAREVHELRSVKRHLEEQLARSHLLEKQRSTQLHIVKEEQEATLTSVKSGYEETIKGLVSQSFFQVPFVVALFILLRTL